MSAVIARGRSRAVDGVGVLAARMIRRAQAAKTRAITLEDVKRISGGRVTRCAGHAIQVEAVDQASILTDVSGQLARHRREGNRSIVRVDVGVDVPTSRFVIRTSDAALAIAA